MHQNTQKILVVGAGFSGLSAAYWLGRHGHQVVVIERSADLRDSGAQVDLRGQGVEVVRRMGLLDQVAAQQVHEAGFAMVDADGTVRSRMMADSSGGTESITAEYEIMRGDFLRILHDAVAEVAEIRFDAMIEQMEETEDHVEVRFCDGSTDTFDLLIGADGQGSRIRRGILSADAPDPYRRSGVNVSYWTVPREETDTDVATMYNAPGGRLLIRRRHSETETQVYFFLREDSPEARAIHRRPLAEQKRFWSRHLEGAGGETARYLDAIEDSDDFYSQEIVRIVADRWHAGRIALVGDAAHGLPPMGWGVTSSIVGTYLLAAELEHHCGDHESAFAAYEKQMRPFITSVAPTSFGFLRLLLPGTARGIRMLHSMGKVARVGMLATSSISARLSLLTDRTRKGSEWTLPEEPAAPSRTHRG